MKTPPENNFTERMLRRSSSMTLLRRRKILAAIEDETCDNLHETMHCNNRNSYISSSSTGTDELVAIIEMLNVEERVELSEEESEINCESKVIEDQDMDIFESPKTKRRCCSPNTKFTSFSPMAKTEIKSLADVDGIISSIPVTNKVKAPSEVEEFLENALEDELNNTMTNDHSKRVQESDGERTNANLDGSELISEVKTPFYKRITRFWNHERQSNSCNVDRISKRLRDTSTLNRSETFYRTLSYTIKKKIRAALTRDKSPEVALPNESQGQLAFDKDAMDMIENILENIKIQQGMIEQASKALSACRMSKELAGNSEEVESERTT
ncbi:uncharacterized protein [Fopius arisanus]|uniref:Uncharacterized protein n=1 Tax=Fopius arisanus TaxID=64838 RepID=A0A9R1TU38_9HYME|nr:PREDICTED: uncharacterized protein LOC105262708 [Fopius arisanus]